MAGTAQATTAIRDANMSAAPNLIASGIKLEYGLLQAWEDLPPSLAMTNLEPNWYWTWVARRDGEIVAALMAGEYHNLLFVGTIKGTPEAGRWWIRGLLRECARESLKRGLKGFMTFVDNSKDGQRLRRLLTRGNVSREAAFQGFCVAGMMGDFD